MYQLKVKFTLIVFVHFPSLSSLPYQQIRYQEPYFIHIFSTPSQQIYLGCLHFHLAKFQFLKENVTMITWSYQAYIIDGELQEPKKEDEDYHEQLQKEFKKMNDMAPHHLLHLHPLVSIAKLRLLRHSSKSGHSSSAGDAEPL